jgi:hypothetical protein
VHLPIALIFSGFTVLAQLSGTVAGTQPPRDSAAAAEPAGTSTIRGRVVAADTGNPIRRANVTLLPVTPAPSAGGSAASGPSRSPRPSSQSTALASPRRPRQAVADADGKFEFVGLPPGSYRLLASSSSYLPQYLGMAYRGKRPVGLFSTERGETIALAQGQTLDKTVIALPRGAVIAGRVTDENAEPLARVQVFAILYPRGSRKGVRTTSVQTDDLGQYRLYGLDTGDYVVGADARENTFVQPNTPRNTDEQSVGYMTTYYPGTTDEAEAQRVRTRVASETSGIEIRLGQGRLFAVSGSVADSHGSPAAHLSGQLARSTPSFAGGWGYSFSTDEQGRFHLINIPPGSYRLIIQDLGQVFGPRARAADADAGEMASVPLTVTGDVENVTVMTTPGATVTGAIVFDQGTPPQVPQIHVFVSPESRETVGGIRSPQPALVRPDLTFQIKGLMGEYTLRVGVPGLFVKSIVAGGQDITDTPREFKSDERVVITLTARASTLEGTVVNTGGTASSDVGVLLFSDDKALWRPSSSRTRRANIDPDGHFRITGLAPGGYLAVALPLERLERPIGEFDDTFLEPLAKEAVGVAIGEDEHRQLELKLVDNNGGG